MDTAVNCHQNRILTITADGQADEPGNHGNYCTSGGDNDQKCPSTHLLRNSDPGEVKSPISHGDNPSCLSDGHPTELTSTPIPSNTPVFPPARKRCQPCPQVRRGKRTKRKVTYLVELV